MKKLNAKRLAALAMTLVMLLGVLTACGDKADTNNGSGSGDLQKAFTRDLVHAWMILSSLFCSYSSIFLLIRNAPPQYGADFVR